jgi:hypothetical protein
MASNNKKNSLKNRYNSTVERIRYGRLHKRDISKDVYELEVIKRKMKTSRIAFAQNGKMFNFSSYGCRLLDALKATIDYLKTVRETIGEKVLAFCIDLFTTLYNIYNNCSWDSLLINATSFFSRHFPQSYAEHAVNWLRNVFSFVTAQNGKGENDEETQSTWKSMILSVFQCSEDFINDQLWKNISEFFVKITTLYTSIETAVSFETLDMEAVFKGFNTFRDSLPKITDIIENVFLAFEYITGNWDNICKGDFSSILLGRDESKEFEIEVRLL